MAIEGLRTHEVVPAPLWNSPLPASQQQKSPPLSKASYDERSEVLPQNKVDFSFSDVVKGTQAGEEVKDDFSFWDFLDVINPLQHIPVVNAVYRYVTGDEIKGASRIAGGAIFGGPLGLAVGAVNAVIAQVEGDDVGGLALTKMFGPSEQNNDTGKVVSEIQTAENLIKNEEEPIKISRFETADLDRAITKLENSQKTNGSSLPEDITYIVADNTYTSSNSTWDAFYSHQMNLEKQQLDALQNALADDTYEQELLYEAERQATAEQNLIRMQREAINKARVEGIQRLKDIAVEKQRQEEAVKTYEKTDQYGLRPSAGMYPTTAAQ